MMMIFEVLFFWFCVIIFPGKIIKNKSTDEEAREGKLSRDVDERDLSKRKLTVSKEMVHFIRVMLLGCADQI